MATRIIAFVCGGIAACLLVAAIYFGISTASYIGQASVADGKVTALSHTNDESGYQAIIQFTTSAGQSVQYSTAVNSNPPEFEVGQTMRVYYSPDDPAASARADSFISLWFLPALFGFLCLIFGGIGAVAFMISIAERR